MVAVVMAMVMAKGTKDILKRSVMVTVMMLTMVIVVLATVVIIILNIIS